MFPPPNTIPDEGLTSRRVPVVFPQHFPWAGELGKVPRALLGDWERQEKISIIGIRTNHYKSVLPQPDQDAWKFMEMSPLSQENTKIR